MKNQLLFLFLVFTLSSSTATAQKFTFHSYMGANYVLPTVDDNLVYSPYTSSGYYPGSVTDFSRDSTFILPGISDTLAFPTTPTTIGNPFRNPIISEDDLVNQPIKTIGKVGFTGGFGIQYNYKRFALSAGIETDLIRYKLIYNQRARQESDVLLVYLNLPIAVHYKLTKKINLSLGGSIDYLVKTMERERERRLYASFSSSPEPELIEAYFVKINTSNKDKFNIESFSLRGGLQYQIKNEYALFLNYRLKAKRVYKEYKDGDEYHWESIQSNLSSVTLGVHVNFK